jgi:hypothetical protein
MSTGGRSSRAMSSGWPIATPSPPGAGPPTGPVGDDYSAFERLWHRCREIAMTLFLENPGRDRHPRSISAAAHISSIDGIAITLIDPAGFDKGAPALLTS